MRPRSWPRRLGSAASRCSSESSAHRRGAAWERPDGALRRGRDGRGRADARRRGQGAARRGPRPRDGRGRVRPADGHHRDEPPHDAVAHIYAVGDCAGYWQLAHTAFREGEVAAENACGHDGDRRTTGRCRARSTPIPEIAGVGLHRGAGARGRTATTSSVGVFPWVATARAVMQAETVGWVKSIHESRYGELLGLVMVGPHVTDLIEVGVVAIDAEGDGRDGRRRHGAAPDAHRGDQGGRAARPRPRDPLPEQEAGATAGAQFEE